MSSVSPARILVVDDEVAQMQALCETLRDSGGYETVGFSEGEAALAALDRCSFELLLTDLTMAGMDGVTLLRKAREKDPDLMGIIMTGQGTIASAVEAMKTGAFDYVLKPFKLSAILPVLSRALEVRKLRLDNIALQDGLRKRTGELEMANRELESFSYSVSHDLRAPLRAIDGFSRIVEEDYGPRLDDEGRRLLGVVRDEAARMARLLEDLLQFSRTARQPLTAAAVDMNVLVREVMAETVPGFPRAQVDAQALPPAVGDAPLLRQVWVNLIDNALKYSSKVAAPLIEIGGRASADGVEYRVRDNGAGFDMRYADRLFGVFQRLHDAAEFPGTGAGLAIVQRIVARHGGRVWAEGEVGKGAVFHFSLPGRDAP